MAASNALKFQSHAFYLQHSAQTWKQKTDDTYSAARLHSTLC